MISLPAQMPLLQVGTHQVAHYEKEWLQETIKRAAHEAGHEKWWFAEDVAKGVIIYLQKRFQYNTITLGELFDKVGRTLTTIGFSDVADKLQPTPPLLRLSLLDVARESGGGFELLFYELLRTKLRELFTLDAERVHCCDLKRCVKHLAATKKWTPHCDATKAEIVDFIQKLTDREPTPTGFNLVIR